MNSTEGDGDAKTSQTAVSDVPRQVSVDSIAADNDIKTRLERILQATSWFGDPGVRVDDGVVFLVGTADSDEHRVWAGELAGKTQDVVAVVNRMGVSDPPLLDIQPALNMMGDLARDSIRSLPLIAIAGAILVLTWLATLLTLKIADLTFLKRIESRLLREVTRKATVIPVILVGLYLVLMVSGLSRLAVTVIGGTGLFGLVLGVAFRDIMENFLSSILISIQHPFKYGDLIEVDAFKGYVQRVNTRGTLLMTFEGNHIQIPNSTIYKGVIKNFTSNPNQRFDFIIGVGYDSSVSKAQQLALDILLQHRAVLDDPQPSVLVEELGSATVNLRCYFWVNGRDYSGLKVKSSVIRQVMRRLEAEGISMPDDAREIVFPAAVPIKMLPDKPDQPVKTLDSVVNKDDDLISNDAEGDFGSDAGEIHQQARASRDPEDDQTDLLSDSPASSGQVSRRKDLAVN